MVASTWIAFALTCTPANAQSSPDRPLLSDTGQHNELAQARGGGGGRAAPPGGRAPSAPRPQASGAPRATPSFNRAAQPRPQARPAFNSAAKAGPRPGAVPGRAAMSGRAAPAPGRAAALSPRFNKASMGQPPRAAAQNRVTPPRQVLGPLASRNRGPAPVASRGNVKGAPVPGYLQRKFNGVAGGLTPIFNAAANPPATPPKSPPEQPPNPRLEPKGPVSKP